MPPRKRPASESYEADGGFVEDAPKSKKSKAIPSGTKNKSSGAKEEPESQYWELGQRTRRVQINEFKGKQLVDIREFYEKDDQMLPGKKGISLNIEQFTAFIEQLPEIKKALKAKDISIPRPEYGEARASPKDEGQDEEEIEEENEEEEEEEEEVKKPAKAVKASDHEEDVKPVAASKLNRFRHKANHEATSDEDN